MIIDFHTHAFPDTLAEKAIQTLEAGCNEKARHGGKISDLLRSMDHARIDKAVICSIATKPSQFLPILEWSRSIRTDRIIPFLSIHPDDENIKEKIKIIFNEGFKGIKLHPYYQKFILDEDKMFKLYECVVHYDLLLLSHTGFDIAFPRDRIADPEKILNVMNKFPELKFVASHLGAWEDWVEVEKKIIGKKIYIENSFSLEILDRKKATEIFKNHPEEYLLFGTDSPWTDQNEAINLLRSLNLSIDLEEKILYRNAKKLLEI